MNDETVKMRLKINVLETATSTSENEVNQMTIFHSTLFIIVQNCVHLNKHLVLLFMLSGKSFNLIIITCKLKTNICHTCVKGMLQRSEEII